MSVVTAVLRPVCTGIAGRYPQLKRAAFVCFTSFELSEIERDLDRDRSRSRRDLLDVFSRFSFGSSSSVNVVSR